MADTTVVHLLRHGEVENPANVLYGRLPGYHLSETGRRMAETVAKAVAARDVVEVRSSPLERAIETASPLAEGFGLDVVLDDRLLEAGNVFEGHSMAAGRGVFRSVRNYRHLWNPFRPSWGERYLDVVARMKGAVDAARTA